MSLRANGTFAPGTFTGGARLGEAVSDSMGLTELAEVLDVSVEHMQHVVAGSAPLPVTARYTRLCEGLALLGSPLDPRVIYEWQRADQAAWHEASGGGSAKKKRIAESDR